MTQEQPISLEVSRIENALRELLAAIEVDAESHPPKEMNWEGVVNSTARWSQSSDAEKLVERPVGVAYRIAMRILGERLIEIFEGDINAVMDVAERAANGPNQLQRMAILLRWWSPLVETKP